MPTHRNSHMTSAAAGAAPAPETLRPAKPGAQIVLTLSRPLPGCKRTRTLIVEGAVGIRPEPLHEVDSVQRALAQVRGVHPPPVMIIDGQTYPCVIEGSPRSPRLMMEDKGEKMRIYM